MAAVLLMVFGMLREERTHLLLGTQIKGVPNAHALGIVHGGAGLNAEQDLMGAEDRPQVQ